MPNAPTAVPGLEFRVSRLTQDSKPETRNCESVCADGSCRALARAAARIDQDLYSGSDQQEGRSISDIERRFRPLIAAKINVFLENGRNPSPRGERRFVMPAKAGIQARFRTN